MSHTPPKRYDLLRVTNGKQRVPFLDKMVWERFNKALNPYKFVLEYSQKWDKWLDCIIPSMGVPQAPTWFIKENCDHTGCGC